jgi:hypothetical protein
MSNIHGTLSRDRTCAYCDSSALPGGTMCSMHYKRAARGSCMNTPKREQLSPWGRVVEAALGLADSDTDDDNEWRRMEGRLRCAVKRWAGVR